MTSWDLTRSLTLFITTLFITLVIYPLNSAWSDPTPERSSSHVSSRAVTTSSAPKNSPSRLLAASAQRERTRHRGVIARRDVEAFARGGLPRQLAQVRLYPERRRGRFVGFKLQQILANSLASQVGFREGDVVMSVNGEPIGRPDQMMHVLSQLPYAPQLKITLMRSGEVIEWVWKIKS